MSFAPFVNAAGDSPLVVLIVEGVKPMARFTEQWPELLLAMDEKGYMTKEIFFAVVVEWESRTRPSDPNAYRALFVDNHYSRFSWDLFLFLDEHKVRLVGMHPHTTAALCVLDCGPFRSFKSNFRTAQNLLTHVTTDADVAGLMKIAWTKTCLITIDEDTGENTSVIIRAFARVGLVPFNAEPLSAEYYLTSDVFKAEGGASDATKSTASRPQLTLGPEELQEIRESVAATAFFTPTDRTVLDKAPRTHMAQLLTSASLILAEAIKATAAAEEALEVANKPWNLLGITFKAYRKIEKLRKSEESAKIKAAKTVVKEAAKNAKLAILAAAVDAKKAKDVTGKTVKAPGAPAAAVPALVVIPNFGPVPVAGPVKGIGKEFKRKRSKETIPTKRTRL